MKQNEQLKIYAERLRLYHINTHLEEMIHEAQINKPSYLDFTLQLLHKEVVCRQTKDFE